MSSRSIPNRWLVVLAVVLLTAAVGIQRRSHAALLAAVLLPLGLQPPLELRDDAVDLRDRIAPKRAQIDLFETATAAAHGEL